MVVEGSNNFSNIGLPSSSDVNHGFMYKAFVHGYTNDKINNTALKVCAITIADIFTYTSIAALGYAISAGFIAVHLEISYLEVLLITALTANPITAGSALAATIFAVVYFGTRTIAHAENHIPRAAELSRDVSELPASATNQQEPSVQAPEVVRIEEVTLAEDGLLEDEDDEQPGLPLEARQNYI